MNTEPTIPLDVALEDARRGDEHDLLHGDVHFSGLKCFSKSAAHYRAYIEHGRKESRPMNVGTIAHSLVLGPHTRRPLVIYEGQRKGKKWETFRDEHVAANASVSIVTRGEVNVAEGIAEAVMRDPVAGELLAGTRREVALAWKDGPLSCATDGIDFVGDEYIGEFKTTTCTDPDVLMRQAFRMFYHAQLAWLEQAAWKNGIGTTRGLFIIGAEVAPPFAVTVMLLTPNVVDEGTKTISRWRERLVVCRTENHWPAYTQRIVDMELPSWMGEGDDDDA